MGFKKGNQNIDSVFYGTDYVERMYLGGEQFFQASFLDFYKTNFFSIGLGQKNQIDNPKGDGAISYIKTEWSSQYGYQLEVNQASAGVQRIIQILFLKKIFLLRYQEETIYSK